MNESSPYSGFIRIRVGGLFVEEGKLLLVKLRSPISNEEIWIPPGGGVNFKEALTDALVREFEEETSLHINVEDLRYTSEIIENEFHVLEFFFDVKKIDGQTKLGSDPEHAKDKQILSDIGFFTKQELLKMNVKPEFLKSEFWDTLVS